MKGNLKVWFCTVHILYCFFYRVLHRYFQKSNFKKHIKALVMCFFVLVLLKLVYILWLLGNYHHWKIPIYLFYPHLSFTSFPFSYLMLRDKRLRNYLENSCFIESFPRISKWKIKILKQILLAPMDRRVYDAIHDF